MINLYRSADMQIIPNDFCWWVIVYEFLHHKIITC